MAGYPRTKSAPIPITYGGATPTVGKVVSFEIQPQPRHLARINLFAKVTTASAAPNWTGDTDGLDAVFGTVRVFLNDTAGGRRTAVEMLGSSLIQWGRRKCAPIDRYTAAALATNTTGTYYLKCPILFEDPTLPDSVSPKTAVPLYDTGDRPKINEAIKVELTLPSAFTNGAGTVTINSMWAQAEFLENVGPGVPYIPSALQQMDWKFAAAGTPDPFWIAKDGYLGSVFVEGYDDAGLTTAGDPFSTAAVGGRVQIKQDETIIDDFDCFDGVMTDDEYISDAAYTATASYKIRALVGPHLLRDFLHTTPGTGGNLPFSMPRIWADSSRVKLTAFGVSASTGFKVTPHRFLAKDIALLAGV